VADEPPRPPARAPPAGARLRPAGGLSGDVGGLHHRLPGQRGESASTAASYRTAAACGSSTGCGATATRSTCSGSAGTRATGSWCRSASARTACRSSRRTPSPRRARPATGTTSPTTKATTRSSTWRRSSHACYFKAGAHPYIFGVDNPDDSLAPMLPGVEEFGAWADWPGRWGASRGLVGRRVRRPQPGEPGASEDEVGGPGHVARPVQGRHAAAVDPRPRPPGGDRHLSEAARHRRPPQGRGDGGRVRSIPHRSAGPRTGW
jgi:hypothetical protein